jgi:hypothetical protein
VLILIVVYQLDQSGKIEQSNLNTVLAIVNSKKYSLLLKKNDKRKLETLFKKFFRIKFYPYTIFAILIAILIKKLEINSKIVIDNEYLGHEKFINEKVLFYLDLLKINYAPVIEFSHVGKTSKAHILAKDVGHQKIKPNLYIKLSEVQKLLLTTKKSAEDRLTQE